MGLSPRSGQRVFQTKDVPAICRYGWTLLRGLRATAWRSRQSPDRDFRTRSIRSNQGIYFGSPPIVYKNQQRLSGVVP